MQFNLFTVEEDYLVFSLYKSRITLLSPIQIIKLVLTNKQQRRFDLLIVLTDKNR